MEYIKLGSTGMKVSRLALGTWRFGHKSSGVIETDKEEAHNLLDYAWEHGINFIDTANVYGDPPGTSEKYIGSWLEDYDREDFVIASKVYFDVDDGPNDRGLSRKHIREQIQRTLTRLGTDYIDIYYMHRWDDETPIEETLSTMNELVRKGKVHYLGASTMAAWKLTKALWKSEVNNWEKIKIAQPQFHAAYPDEVADYLDVCSDQNLAICPYSPLAGGFLTGKYKRSEEDPKSIEAPDGSRGSIDENFEDWYVTDRAWDVLDKIREISNELDATPAQVSLRWIMENERFTTVPLVGARTIGQLKENLGSTEIELSREQFEEISNARKNE
ncbi:MAG: aldo/keto reductase [Candidatus Hadarchaeota archaeon]